MSGSDLVTRATSGVAAASSPDGPGARPAPAGDWPNPGSSCGPWARPATAAGWRPCWPAGKPVGYSISGGNGYAGRARITGDNGGTCVVWLNSWGCSKITEQPCSLKSSPEPKKTPRKKTRKKKTAKEENDLLKGWKKIRRKKTPFSNRPIYPTFRTALTSPHYTPL